MKIDKLLDAKVDNTARHLRLDIVVDGIPSQVIVSRGLLSAWLTELVEKGECALMEPQT